MKPSGARLPSRDDREAWTVKLFEQPEPLPSHLNHHKHCRGYKTGIQNLSQEHKSFKDELSHYPMDRVQPEIVSMLFGHHKVTAESKSSCCYVSPDLVDASTWGCNGCSSNKMRTEPVANAAGRKAMHLSQTKPSLSHLSQTKPSLSPLPPGTRGFDIFRDDHDPQTPSHAVGAHPGLRDKIAAETYTALFGSPTKRDEDCIVGAKSAPHVSVLDERGTSPPHNHRRSPSPHRSTSPHRTHAHPPNHRHPAPNFHTDPHRQHLHGEKTCDTSYAGLDHDSQQHRGGELGVRCEKTIAQVIHEAHEMYDAVNISKEENDARFEAVMSKHKFIGGSAPGRSSAPASPGFSASSPSPAGRAPLPPDQQDGTQGLWYKQDNPLAMATHDARVHCEDRGRGWASDSKPVPQVRHLSPEGHLHRAMDRVHRKSP